MQGYPCAWTAGPRLEDLALYRDWDHFAGMALSLRQHGTEHGVVPLVNFALGGRPELANPQSWAWTWPSLFAYALPPNAALLAAWASMTALGLAAAFALLRRWCGGALGPAAGAALFALSPYFAAHFNVGHVTFAFFHLVPLAMLALERALDALRTGRPATLQLAAIAGAGYAVATAAIPHGAFYLAPLALLRMAQVALEERRSARPLALTLAPLLLALGLGALSGAHKVAPSVLWQLLHPRPGVTLEALAPWQVAGNALRWTSDFAERDAVAFDGQQWGTWEHTWYVGPLALAVAALGLLRLRPRSAADARERAALRLALASGALGLALALGNRLPVLPGFWLRALPPLDGIRVFPRFQVLLLFGTAVAVASALGAVERRRSGSGRGLAALLAAVVLAAPLAQSAVLAARIPARAQAELGAGHPEVPPGLGPRLARQRLPRGSDWSSHVALLRRGYWIADPAEFLALEPAPAPTAAAGPLAEPAPVATRVGFDGVELAFAPEIEGLVVLALPLGGTAADPAPIGRDPSGRALFSAADLAGRSLRLRAARGPFAFGLGLSGAAAVALAAWLLLRARRR